MDTTAQARLEAVEILLAEPELLGNDALETDLYILRDQLQASTAPASGRERAVYQAGVAWYCAVPAPQGSSPEHGDI